MKTKELPGRKRTRQARIPLPEDVVRTKRVKVMSYLEPSLEELGSARATKLGVSMSSYIAKLMAHDVEHELLLPSDFEADEA